MYNFEVEFRFFTAPNRRLFVSTLEEVCAKAQWQVHAWCLMSNHFHLVVETPQPNLVAGMKWLLGIYTKRFNIGRAKNRLSFCAARLVSGQ